MNSNAHQNRDSDRLIVAIQEDQITVAPASQGTLHIGIQNDSPGDDYIEILVNGVPPEWVILQAPVLHLGPGEAKLVTLTLQPSSVSSGRVERYPLSIRAFSQSDPKRSAVVRAVLTVAAYQSRGRIGLMLGTIHFSAVPGASFSIPVVVQNRGDEEDSFRWKVIGLPGNWVSSGTAVSPLEPDSSEEIQLNLHVPRSSVAAAGRRPFTIQIASERYPTQTADVECILTIAAFSQFSAVLEPRSLQAGQRGQLIVSNEGNTSDTYSLYLQSPDNELIFEKVVQVVKRGSQSGSQQVELAYVEIPKGEKFQVQAGERAVYPFRSRVRSRPILGGERTYPYTADVRSTENRSVDVHGEILERAFFPSWTLIPVGLMGLLFVCLLFLASFRNVPTAARATQTASASQTQAALSGQADSDGDGLSNDREAALGTDPLLADTDGDRLQDREEVETYQTDPLKPDTDGDGLLDGDELQTHQTDPRLPDTDGDGLGDGDEIGRGIDPRNPDSDGDGVRDGDEIRLETNPGNPDSDGDGLRDGEENANCPSPRDPDSDDDGIVDGRDLDPCNASNPALTATAPAGAAQATAAAPTWTLTPASPTVPAATSTLVPPSLSGIMLFSSDRDGNAEIYALNLANLASARLTNNSAQDVQPALAPDSVQLVYVSNQSGNNEIYLTGVNGGTPLNLTNHAGDDQQPTWSPDGAWIAFTSNRDGNQEIYVMRLDGSEVRNLTNDAASDSAPTWFSVGGLDWIAFTSTRDGNQEIYKVRPDGTGLANLTQNPATDHSPAGFAGGGLIAFVSDRSGNWEIYTMNETGSSQSNITNSSAQDFDPVVNQGGTWIAFTTARDGNLEIYFMATTGGSAFNLTRHLSQDRDPDW